MQIWKFHFLGRALYKRSNQQCPENFELLMLEILQLFPREIDIFLEK